MKSLTCKAFLFVLILLISQGTSFADADSQADQILKTSGVKGGLIVHVGCGDGKLTAALGKGAAFLVQGLDADSEKVIQARQNIKQAGLYGKVSVDKLNSKWLPYTDNLVNLLIIEKLGDIPRTEINRVLCPGGVALVKNKAKWRKIQKPAMKGADQWTHYLYDSTNNAVSNDTVVGPPRHYQWVGSPRWSRHHDRMASMAAAVSANGRLFYIFDEGSTASVQLPQKRMLIARDAYNGTILWKRPLKTWFTHMWPFKSGPAWQPRRLVASGDSVYVTMGIEAPLVELDAVTGATVQAYKTTDATEEVLESEGELFVLTNKRQDADIDYEPQERVASAERNRVAQEYPWDKKSRLIQAIDADSGKVIWEQEYSVVPLSLAVDGSKVVFHDGDAIIALNRKNGKKIWKSDPVQIQENIPTSFGATLVLYEEAVLFSGGTNSITGLSAKDGKILWTSEKAKSGHNCPEDVLVAGGLAWAGATASGSDSGIFTGWDPLTGEVKGEFAPDVETHWFHQRCYRSKATVNFLMPSRTGIEYVDFRKEHWDTNHWVRGGCLYGVIPCNGLTYAPPHSCGCYLDAKLCGFSALAPASETRALPALIFEPDRFEKGPAYQKKSKSKTKEDIDWPTYRSDGQRSGKAACSVSTKLSKSWQTDIGGKISSVTVAGGKVFLAQVDAHTVHAIDQATGEKCWSYMAGGRVDSPPTYYQGNVLFGSADGWVYCLTANEGTLVWRYRGAPMDRKMTAYEQVESVWPIHGSILVENDIAHFVAGRSLFLDGGMRLIRLNAATGEKISEMVMDERDPTTGANIQEKIKGLNMPTSLPDVLSTDGESLYMRTQRFDMEGRRNFVGPIDAREQSGEGKHLFCQGGFLDGDWFHRNFFIYGKGMNSGAGGWFQAGRYAPAGRLLVLDEATVYGYGRKPEYFKWSTPLEYHIFASSKSPELENIQDPHAKTAVISQPQPTRRTNPRASQRRTAMQAKKAKSGSSGNVNIKIGHDWSKDFDLNVQAMLLAGDVIFAAGTPDITDEEYTIENYNDKKVQADLKAQDAAFLGAKGAMLRAVSTKDGSKLAEYELDQLPVWDGMAAADGNLYMATQDGKVTCFAGK